MPSYSGPRKLNEALSAFHLLVGEGAAFHREGLRAEKHIRAIGPFEQPTGWHWHDMHAHFIYVLRGWIKFRFDGVEGEVTLKAGDSLSQSAGVPHNVIARSDDFEVLELNVPAEYGTFDLPKGGG